MLVKEKHALVDMLDEMGISYDMIDDNYYYFNNGKVSIDVCLGYDGMFHVEAYDKKKIDELSKVYGCFIDVLDETLIERKTYKTTNGVKGFIKKHYIGD